MARQLNRFVAHAWVPIISIVMIGIGFLIVLAGMEEAKLIAYQIFILGSMFIGLGFLSISIFALLSHSVAMSEVEIGYLAKQSTKPSTRPVKVEKTHPFCENCGTPLKSGAKFCAECGAKQ